MRHSHAHFTHFFDHIGRDVFNCPHWGSREFQNLLDLEAGFGSKLNKNNQRANLQLRSDVEYERLSYHALESFAINFSNLAPRAVAKDKGVGVNQQPVVAHFGAKKPL